MAHPNYNPEPILVLMTLAMGMLFSTLHECAINRKFSSFQVPKDTFPKLKRYMCAMRAYIYMS